MNKIRHDQFRRKHYVKRHIHFLVAKFLMSATSSDSREYHIGSLLMKGRQHSTPVRLVRRCVHTGRPRGVFRRWKLSRLAFRRIESLLPDITKASW